MPNANYKQLNFTLFLGYCDLSFEKVFLEVSLTLANETKIF